MQFQCIECVTNFSEGRNHGIIDEIAATIRTTFGVKLLHVDVGYDANRTVMTFAGEPNAVTEAAYRAIGKASEIIDMRIQKGEHPRMGATDVCPFIPLWGISMEETIGYACQLAERVGNELKIPVFLYDQAARIAERKSLAYCRKGEYEGLPSKLKTPEGKPDFGPAMVHPKAGAIAIGARKFLAAFNVNINTKSVDIAKRIAGKVRESGYFETTYDGKKHIPGKLHAVRAIGWYMEKYGCAQVSTNLIDLDITPLHIAFNTIAEIAETEDVCVTGSELIGLIPLQSMLDAGKYFDKDGRFSVDKSHEEYINIAIETLGLNAVVPFRPKEKILQYALQS